jgi:hypothetical protein
VAPEAVNVTDWPGCMVADGGLMVTGCAKAQTTAKTNKNV